MSARLASDERRSKASHALLRSGNAKLTGRSLALPRIKDCRGAGTFEAPGILVLPSITETDVLTHPVAPTNNWQQPPAAPEDPPLPPQLLLDVKKELLGSMRAGDTSRLRRAMDRVDELGLRERFGEELAASSAERLKFCEVRDEAEQDMACAMKGWDVVKLEDRTQIAMTKGVAVAALNPARLRVEELRRLMLEAKNNLSNYMGKSDAAKLRHWFETTRKLHAVDAETLGKVEDLLRELERPPPEEPNVLPEATGLLREILAVPKLTPEERTDRLSNLFGPLSVQSRKFRAVIQAHGWTGVKFAGPPNFELLLRGLERKQRPEPPALTLALPPPEAEGRALRPEGPATGTSPAMPSKPSGTPMRGGILTPSRPAGTPRTAGRTSQRGIQRVSTPQVMDDVIFINVEAGAEIAEMHPVTPKVSRKNENLYHRATLAEAFAGYVKKFEDDDDSAFSVEELVNFLRSAEILDDFLTPEGVRLHCASMANGSTEAEYGGALEPCDPENIDWWHFEAFLRFASDMKGIRFVDMEKIIVGHFSRNSAESSSMRWRMEVIFEAFAKEVPGRINALEFSNLLQRTGIISYDCENSGFKVGDALTIFAGKDTAAARRRVDSSLRHASVDAAHSVDFDGFLQMIDEVGRRSHFGKNVWNKLSSAVDELDNNEFVIVRIRLNLKDAAAKNGVVDWSLIFMDIDPDESGQITCEEFLEMCRQKLHVKASEWELRMLFRKLDRDKSGELGIDELVQFITDGVVKERGPTMSYERAMLSDKWKVIGVDDTDYTLLT